MEGGRCLGRVVDDEVVDIIVVDDVRDVANLLLSWNPVLLLVEPVRTCKTVIVAHCLATLL
jgi:hypothetical protein